VVDGGGLLCPPGDEACLIAALSRLFEDPDEAARLRERGLEHARTFRWERTAETISAAVDEVTGR
jgi:glycosyltransferase involved in cell wall biosynthesis